MCGIGMNDKNSTLQFFLHIFTRAFSMTERKKATIYTRLSAGCILFSKETAQVKRYKTTAEIFY